MSLLHSEGNRFEISRGEPGYPDAFSRLGDPPERIYLIGDPKALEEGLAIVGARKATPYGAGCARRFAVRAAQRGVTVISGGARGCDAAAHLGALDAGGRTVAFLGGGCDRVYPREHAGLFRRIIEQGGALASENPWGFQPLGWTFRRRNRLIASLARATLIVEAGLPSGTFSTADEALSSSRDVLVVPGAITAASSRGANRLLYQGASPIVDDESFDDALFSLFGCLKQQTPSDLEGGPGKPRQGKRRSLDPVAAALAVEPLRMDDLLDIAQRHCGSQDARSWLAVKLAEAEASGLAARYPDGSWGPIG